MTDLLVILEKLYLMSVLVKSNCCLMIAGYLLQKLMTCTFGKLTDVTGVQLATGALLSASCVNVICEAVKQTFAVR